MRVGKGHPGKPLEACGALVPRTHPVARHPKKKPGSLWRAGLSGCSRRIANNDLAEQASVTRWLRTRTVAVL